MTAPMKWTNSSTSSIVQKFVKQYNAHMQQKMSKESTPNNPSCSGNPNASMEFKLDPKYVHLAVYNDHTKQFKAIPSDIPIFKFLQRITDATLFIRDGRALTQAEMITQSWSDKSNSIDLTSGTVVCTRYGCKNTQRISDKKIFGPCLFHRAPPVFLKDSMYWACCPTQTVSDFSKLINIRGCQFRPECTLNEKQFLKEMNLSSGDTSLHGVDTKDKTNEADIINLTNNENLLSSVLGILSTDGTVSTREVGLSKTSTITKGAISLSTSNVDKGDEERSDRVNSNVRTQSDVVNNINEVDADLDLERDGVPIPDNSDLSNNLVIIEGMMPHLGKDQKISNSTNVSVSSGKYTTLSKYPSLVKFKKVLHSFGVDSVLYNTVIDDMKHDFKMNDMEEDQLDDTVKERLSLMLKTSFQALADTQKEFSNEAAVDMAKESVYESMERNPFCTPQKSIDMEQGDIRKSVVPMTKTAEGDQREKDAMETSISHWIQAVMNLPLCGVISSTHEQLTEVASRVFRERTFLTDKLDTCYQQPSTEQLQELQDRFMLMKSEIRASADRSLVSAGSLVTQFTQEATHFTQEAKSGLRTNCIV